MSVKTLRDIVKEVAAFILRDHPYVPMSRIAEMAEYIHEDWGDAVANLAIEKGETTGGWQQYIVTSDYNEPIYIPICFIER